MGIQIHENDNVAKDHSRKHKNKRIERIISEDHARTRQTNGFERNTFTGPKIRMKHKE